MVQSRFKQIAPVEVQYVRGHEIHVVFLVAKTHNERAQILKTLSIAKDRVGLHNGSKSRRFVRLQQSDPVFGRLV